MQILFCSDYWNPRSPDSAYACEASAAEQSGFPISLINFETLVDQHNATRAIRNVAPASPTEIAIYRGWMLTSTDYERLYTALTEKGLLLINTPAAYKHCHYLPESYHEIAEITPRTTWLKGTGATISMDQVMEALQIFGDHPIIVKDFVKSRKHEWYEACYIPSAIDRLAVEKVVTRFLQLQDEDLQEGLVFREFVELEPLTTHPRSGMPLAKEFRLFVLDGRIILSLPYWEEGDYQGDAPPETLFAEIAQRIASRFFTIDVAKKKDGSWIILELGDGQVAGLPRPGDARALYQVLAH